MKDYEGRCVYFIPYDCCYIPGLIAYLNSILTIFQSMLVSYHEQLQFVTRIAMQWKSCGNFQHARLEFQSSHYKATYYRNFLDIEQTVWFPGSFVYLPHFHLPRGDSSPVTYRGYSHDLLRYAHQASQLPRVQLLIFVLYGDSGLLPTLVQRQIKFGHILQVNTFFILNCKNLSDWSQLLWSRLL